MTEHLNPVDGRWPDLVTLTALLRDRAVTATDLVTGCLRRIADLDGELNAVLAVNPLARAEAAASDTRLAAGAGRPLEGVPVLVKDNIDTAGLASTAGSPVLAGRPPGADAAVVARLRAAGAVVLGKTNLSEWGNFRGTDAVEGWSTLGGQTRNPHHLAHSPWGSSSGSAAAVAAGYVPIALGTETDGSIVCPAAACGVVGLKPALGLLPTTGIVPITPELDTPGLLARSVADAAAALAALTGDAAPDLSGEVAGLRIAVWPGHRADPATTAFADRVSAGLRERGAVVTEAALRLEREPLDDALAAMIAEFAPALAGYLRTRPGAPSDVDGVLAANRADRRALALFGQNLLELAAGVPAADRALAAERRARARQWATGLLDNALAGVDCVVTPTGPPAWPIDHDRGDPPVRTGTTVPALAGRPVVAVPAGLDGDLPLGVLVFGPPDTATALRHAAAVAAGWTRPVPTIRPGHPAPAR